MAEKSLLIVGPGNSFTTELIDTFSREQYSIGIIGRNHQTLGKLASFMATNHIHHHAEFADVTDELEVRNAVQGMSTQLPPWQTIIYNVKDSHRGNLLSVDTNRALESINSNVIGAIHMSRAALEKWSYTDNASIILSGGNYRDEPHLEKVGLSLSKGALHTLCLLMKQSFAPFDIAVHDIDIVGEVTDPQWLSEQYLSVAE